MDLSTATVLVTGANRGIGHALIRELRARGVPRIYAAARKPEVFSEVAGDTLVPIYLDITDRGQVQAAATVSRAISPTSSLMRWPANSASSGTPTPNSSRRSSLPCSDANCLTGQGAVDAARDTAWAGRDGLAGRP
jgi:NAD(P)-dependent dehydrogenase (short-subunit alcohol dehydrogenase family)